MNKRLIIVITLIILCIMSVWGVDVVSTSYIHKADYLSIKYNETNTQMIAWCWEGYKFPAYNWYHISLAVFIISTAILGYMALEKD